MAKGNEAYTIGKTLKRVHKMSDRELGMHEHQSQVQSVPNTRKSKHNLSAKSKALRA